MEKMKAVLDQYVESELVTKRDHPFLPLSIYNYTKDVVYNNKWDDVVKHCRGLVVDNENHDIVAYPFPKFFNLEEHRHTPTKDFEVFEKLDGSLGIVFVYKGELIVATRGSFTSDQAIRGKEILLESPTCKFNFKEGYTYLYEIIYPENRIVINYEKPEMVLLAAYKNDDIELSYNELFEYDLNVVARYHGIEDYTTLRDIYDGESREGFVVRFSNGQRCKLKYAEYCRLHFMMTEMSTTRVWESLKAETSICLDVDIPDEMFNLIKDYEDTLLSQYKEIEDECRKFTNCNMPRKEFAELVLRENKKYSSIIFAMVDGKNYSDKIWNLIKPEYRKL